MATAPPRMHHARRRRGAGRPSDRRRPAGERAGRLVSRHLPSEATKNVFGDNNARDVRLSSGVPKRHAQLVCHDIR
jgi:hypothetical protein